METTKSVLSERSLKEIYEALLNSCSDSYPDYYTAVVDGKLGVVVSFAGLIPVGVNVHGIPIFKSA